MIIALEALAIVLGIGGLLWVASLALRNSSIIDIAWGPFFFVLAFAEWIQIGRPGGRSLLVLALVGTWAFRLAMHLFLRNGIAHEDRRYTAMRTRFGARWWIVSLPFVFVFQPLLVFLVGAPVQAAVLTPRTSLGWIDGLATVTVIVGVCFEASADVQLARFRARGGSGVLDTGLWRYTRHPNYFGDFVVWWGFGMFGVAAGAPWTLVGPLVMTILLLRVSGVSLLERTIVERRPEYVEYQRRTNAFFPGRPHG